MDLTSVNWETLSGRLSKLSGSLFGVPTGRKNSRDCGAAESNDNGCFTERFGAAVKMGLRGALSKFGLIRGPERINSQSSSSSIKRFIASVYVCSNYDQNDTAYAYHTKRHTTYTSDHSWNSEAEYCPNLAEDPTKPRSMPRTLQVDQVVGVVNK